MLAADVSSIVFVEGERPCGILSRADLSTLCMLMLTGRALPSRERLAVDDFFTLSVDADSGEAWELMQRRRCRQLVLVDEHDRLAGILTSTDLLRAKVSLIESQNEHLEQRVADRTRDLRRSNEKLHSLSRVDPMLHIGNRRAMDEAMVKVFEHARRYKRPFSVALIDADYFKLYNDFYGHQAGDVALIDIARTIRKNIRATDTVYRYGGEEFLVLLPEVGAEGAAIAARKICDAVAARNLAHERSPLSRLSVSIGVAEQHTTMLCRTRVISAADVALYRAKQRGRNRVEIHETGPDIDERAA